MNDEEEERVGDSNKKNTPLLRSRKRRCFSAARDKPSLKCRINVAFFSPLSSNEETETKYELDIGNYAPSNRHHILNPRFTPFYSTDLKRATSNNDTIELISGRSDRLPLSRMPIIYEQQEWEGEIIAERDAKQGCGTPRKQYLVRWK